MELFYLLRREIKEPLRPFIIFITLSGIAAALLISLINMAAENASNSELNHQIFLLFAVGVAVVLLTKKYVLDKSVVIVESVMFQLRNRIINKIRQTELDILESIGPSSIYARLTQDAGYISTVASTLVSSLQSAIMIVFTTIYIATISIWSFVMVVAAIGIGVAYYFNFLSSFQSIWMKVSERETAFVENVGYILNGFKEIKINRRKNEEVYYNYINVNKDLKNYRSQVILSYNKMLIFTQVLFYILLGCILFLLPQFHTEHSEDVIKVTAAVLFIIGPFEGLVNSVRYFDNANTSTRNINALEQRLEEMLNKARFKASTFNQPEAFNMLSFEENIRFENLSYSYARTKRREHVFTVGPVNLTIQKGELIFITGGNGSGKSTFLKLLTGLYPPKSGRIVIDADVEEKPETPLTDSNYQQYRNLFTTIFTDFHLFDKLYGIDKVDSNKVNLVLKNMGLPEDKTSYLDGAFTNLNLSTGQKKRLALTTSIIEDKQIYVLDEVAADLDPQFRDKYYYDLLTELKQRNKTVIVVSHDRHYWTVPDRIFEMEDGLIRELSKKEIESLLSFENQEDYG